MKVHYDASQCRTFISVFARTSSSPLTLPCRTGAFSALVDGREVAERSH